MTNAVSHTDENQLNLACKYCQKDCQPSCILLPGCQLAQYWKLSTKSEALRILSSKLYDFQVQGRCKTHITLGITTQFILLQQKQCLEKMIAQSVSACREY